MILILTQCFPLDTGGIETLMGGLAQALSADRVVFAGHFAETGMMC